MDAENLLLDDLKALVGQRKVLAVLGAGVSANATWKATRQAPDWLQLIETGVRRCQALQSDADECDLHLKKLAEKKTGKSLLRAASFVEEELKEKGEFGRWLRDEFESLKAEKPQILQVIHQLGIPIVTTNYDDLLEAETKLKSLDWTQGGKLARVAREEDRRVFHLHGIWDEPDSVVLGLQSYDKVKNEAHTQAVLRAMGVCKSFLFIGCGEGLSDPNFGAFLEWLHRIEKEADVEHRHYRLILASEREAVAQEGKIHPLVYGEGYEDLPGFLEKLIPEGNRKEPSEQAVVSLQERPDKVQCYLERLEKATEKLSLLGLGRSLQIELPIADAYVPLKARLARQFALRASGDRSLGEAESEQEIELNEVFCHAAAEGKRGVVVLGEPGAGKTTGARQLLWRLVSGESLPTDLGLPEATVPVFLRFRALSWESFKAENGLRHFLDSSTQCSDAPDGLQRPGDALWNGDAGPLLWVLDGLDEVVDPESRQTVSAWIRSALENRPQDWFLVTCRFQGYKREGVPLGPRFLSCEVRSLERGQIEIFVRDWFRLAYEQLYPGQPEIAEERSAALLHILSQPSGKMGELTTSPLLLTILCIVFHEEQKLPTGRADLYGHCVRVLLESWRHDLYKGGKQTGIKAYDAKAATAVLAHVAWWMHGQPNRTEAPIDELVPVAEEALAGVSPESGLGTDGAKFLGRMREEAGILAFVSDGLCGFLHLSFQEYLAAEHALAEGHATFLAQSSEVSWWQEVILLALRGQRKFCEGFFQELIQAGLIERNPEWVGRCLNEAAFPAHPIFVRELGRLLDESDVWQRGEEPRVKGLLNLFREREERSDAFADALRRLMSEGDPETSELAQAILLRQGMVVPTTKAASGVRLSGQTKQVMIEIPAGSFEREGKRVSITRPFLLGKYPVTNRQYKLFLDDVQGMEQPSFWDDRRFNQPDQPVVGVSWGDARRYCEWDGGRFPTEAEWEYACRAGSNREYCFGNDEGLLKEYAWFIENSQDQTQPVGTKKPNEWGFHDMHGNVWEWCEDWHSYEYYLKTPANDPVGPQSGSLRVFRGGSWSDSATNCRSAYRSMVLPVYRDYLVGFRVARSSIKSKKSAASNGG